MHRALASALALSSVILVLGGCDDPTRLGPDAQLARGSLADGPTNLSAGPVSPHEMAIGWIDNSRNEGGFELHRSTTGETGAFSLRAHIGADVTSHRDTELAQGGRYCYKIRSFKVYGKTTSYSAFDGPVCATTLNPPAAPTELAVVPASSQVVDVSWRQLSSPVNGFRVERAAAPDGPWESATTFIAASPYRDVNRTPEAQVCYRVVAFNNDGSSPSSAVDCTVPPTAPTDLAAVSADAQSIDLSWTDGSAAEDGFEIQRSIGNGVWGVIATPPANATTHRDAGLATDTRYFYRIRARKDGGFSDFSGSASALTVGTLPAAPTSVAAHGSGSTAAGVSWSSTGANVEGFRVERSTNDGASWEIAGSVPSSHRGFGEDGRTPDAAVCYRVFAVNRLGDSPASATDCVTPPKAVTDLAAAPAGNGSITLTWTNPSRVTTGYSLEYYQSYGYGGYGGYGCGYGYGCYYPYAQWTSIAILPADATTHTVTGFDPSRLHEFRIVTLAPDAQADPSPVAASLTETPPITPSNVTATVVAAGSVEVRWSDNSTNESNFIVQMCAGTPETCTDGHYDAGQYLEANTTSFTRSGLQAGATYTFRVYATSGAATSEFSNTATVTLSLLPEA